MITNDILFNKEDIITALIFLSKQVSIPVGCVPLDCWPYLPAYTVLGKVSVPRGVVYSREVVSVPGGMPAPGGGGSAIPACTEADAPCEQNDRQV